jgi:site-specific recombinase XerD
MYNPNPPAVSSPQISNEEMAKDHAQILQNYFDSLTIQRLSAKTIDFSRWFIERWFEENGVVADGRHRPLYVWEAMKLLEGRKRIKDFLLSLSTPDDDGLPVLQASTVRAYANQLERLFASIVDFPYIDGFLTISSKYGPIENPFTRVQYPIHNRDHLRSERFFLTPEQILELLIFLREVYPRLTHRTLTAARLYTMVLLTTETGMRSIEILNLDAIGENRDIFYDRKVIQTRFGKGCNSSGSLTRLIPLTRPAEITLKEYEARVRPHFKNSAENPSLFLSSDGNRLSYSAMQSGFSTFVASARKHGVNLPEKLTIHDLRASFATNYLEEHPDRFWRLMELLGHTSPSSTCLYIRSRGKSRLLTMKEARGPRVPGTGLSAMVYNR